MPSPATTGRTFWFNASDNDKLWGSTTPGSGGNPGDGGGVQSWDDEDAGNEFFSEGTNPPVWRSNGINSIGAVDFDGTNDRLLGSGSGATLSNVISATAFTVFVSFLVEGTSDAGLIGDDGFFMGIFVKNGQGFPHSVQAFNNDGAVDTLELPIQLNTPYVAMMRHDGGSIFFSLNRGFENSVASGNTSTLTGTVAPALQGVTFLNGRIGEILMYNVALTGTDLSDTYQYMTDKWVPAPVGGMLGALATSHARLG